MLHSANLQRVALKALGSCRKIGINSLFSSRLLCRCFWQQFRGATKTKITPKIAFLTRISPFLFPNLTKTLGWVGVVTDLGKLSPKKRFFTAPLSYLWNCPFLHPSIMLNLKHMFRRVGPLWVQWGISKVLGPVC